MSQFPNPEDIASQMEGDGWIKLSETDVYKTEGNKTKLISTFVGGGDYGLKVFIIQGPYGNDWESRVISSNTLVVDSPEDPEKDLVDDLLEMFEVDEAYDYVFRAALDMQ